MEIKEIRQLIKLVETADISEIEIVEEGKKLRISKNNKHTGEAVMMSQVGIPTYQPPPSPSPSTPATTGQESSISESVPAEAEPLATSYKEVRSPMVGTFYRSPAPDADPYVEVGQNIESGQTLCIIEAMKLMNELESEFTGKVAKILVENAQPVEYNQVLFLIEQ